MGILELPEIKNSHLMCLSTHCVGGKDLKNSASTMNLVKKKKRVQQSRRSQTPTGLIGPVNFEKIASSTHLRHRGIISLFGGVISWEDAARMHFKQHYFFGFARH